mgnify:CR=1 FL=1
MIRNWWQKSETCRMQSAAQCVRRNVSYFQMAMLMIPESKHAWQEIGRFLDIMEHHLPAEHLDEEDKEIESNLEK